MYISAHPNEHGNYGNPQSHGDGIYLPDSLLGDYVESMGFVNLITDDDGNVIAVSRNEEAYSAYMNENPPHIPTGAELREEAYNTERLIEWENKLMTVTEAAQIWQYYASENDYNTAGQLTSLIAEAKADIRERFTD